MASMRPLTRHLLGSAAEFTKRSLEAGANEAHLIPLYASIGLEHALKAHLVEVNPLLIVGKDEKMVSHRWLADETKHEAPPPDRIKTIGCEQALDACLRFGVSLDAEALHLRRLMARRNDIAHMGHSDQTADDDLLGLHTAYLTALSKLLPALGVQPTHFFGHWAAHVNARIGERQAEIDSRLDLLVTAAAMEFARRHGDPGPSERQNLESSVRTLFETKAYDEQIVTCPACSMPCLVYGELDVSYEPEFDRDGDVINAYPVVGYRPLALRCPTCGLRLDRELLDASGLMENWVMPSDDEEGFLEVYEDLTAGPDDYYGR